MNQSENPQPLPDETSYVSRGLLIYDDEGESFVETVRNNAFGVEIEVSHIDRFEESPAAYIQPGGHLLVAASTAVIERLLHVAIEHQLSIGFLPFAHQKLLIRQYRLSSTLESNLEVALRDTPQAVDLIDCDGRLMQFKGIVGEIPLVGIGSSEKSKGVRRFLYGLNHGVRQFFTMTLQAVSIVTANEKSISSAVSGLIIRHSRPRDFYSRFVGGEYSMRDGQVGVILISPFSVIEYIAFLLSAFSSSTRKRSLPASVGQVRSRTISIETGQSRWLHIDGALKVELPVTCSVLPDAVRINAPGEFWEANPQSDIQKESVKIDNLPDEKESAKYRGKHIPLFSYASEEHFRDLFGALRDDAQINGLYIVFMILSALLATLGLLANSAAVVIGAMLIAPLMAPIVSLSMGLLRADSSLINASWIKVTLGMVLVLLASLLVTLLLPELELTDEIKARIHPTVLDMGVAIVSGIAAAYSKSFKEVVQSLAGVAIAVALVPPLATAGIGLGLGDWQVFWQAFLLFNTNFFGIILAAILTFLVLGYSDMVKSKKSVIAIVVVLLAISYPLYLTFYDTVTHQRMAEATGHKHFLIGGKAVHVRVVESLSGDESERLDLHLVVNRTLLPGEREELKRNLERIYQQQLRIFATVEYMIE
ncbi:MAG: TIGR00341 family protein [Pseudomonadota bacterium]|nr:TIGR00341 family protein [Pseudomonadota bacterium]